MNLQKKGIQPVGKWYTKTNQPCKPANHYDIHNNVSWLFQYIFSDNQSFHRATPKFRPLLVQLSRKKLPHSSFTDCWKFLSPLETFIPFLCKTHVAIRQVNRKPNIRNKNIYQFEDYLFILKCLSILEILVHWQQGCRFETVL